MSTDNLQMACRVSCEDGYDFIYRPAELYYCVGENWFTWPLFPKFKIPWSDCASKCMVFYISTAYQPTNQAGSDTNRQTDRQPASQPASNADARRTKRQVLDGRKTDARRTKTQTQDKRKTDARRTKHSFGFREVISEQCCILCFRDI